MRQLNKFNSAYKLQIRIRFILWSIVSKTIFQSSFSSSYFRRFLLKLFGAKVGNRVVIRSKVRIHFPWNLDIGDDCWIGEEVWFINHEMVTIGSDVCVSQRSIICTGGHDYRSFNLEYAHKPVEINDGAWICLDAKVLPGVTIGECSVVSAGEIARRSLPDYSMLIAGQIRQIDPPK